MNELVYLKTPNLANVLGALTGIRNEQTNKKNKTN